ncbi:hypothetical protein BJY01DRAFT_244500 [Aspergillus pseudoustus]|uniref:AT hook motif protein n=1 Tax=Aspergillus pseudoustus TaxID=1810923 RepID=A0ABR4KJN6_9EURO
MPMIWNDQTDAKLLVAIITTTDAKLNHAAIAEFMGPDCSTSAVQHRIQRLREKVKTIVTDGATEGNITPKKRGRPGKNVAAGDENANPAGGDSPKKPKASQKEKHQTKVVKEEEDTEMAIGDDEPSAGAFA